VLARLQRLPSTVYTVPGILPLVPGSRAYQATVALLAGDSAAAGGQAQAAFLAAGGIAAGVLLASALPRLLRSRALDRKAPPHYDGEVGRFQA
ncbi:MAG TPA: threonine/serine exporter family protein, partial [Candidatus Nitrosotenuis sp.]|nr:threonine/serine exporter family protein [Candidatus Nitrosotenuis sp.]